MRIGLAVRAFFRTLWNAECAQRVEQVLEGAVAEPPDALPAPTSIRDTVIDRAARRSEAITLLATLQREARLVDLVMEPLGGYSDAQVGAAARDVLRDCGQVLQRLFDIRPVIEQEEGALVEVPAGYDAERFRLTGNVGGTPPFRGRLAHHGWTATHCELPTWSGSEAARWIIAPPEIELS